MVADGVGGGAMASWASRELVLRLHAALDRRRVDADSVRDALLDADREVGRSIARHTADSGAATVALCAGTDPSLSQWLIAWVGDCRIYRVRAGPDKPIELLTQDDTYGHLGENPPPGGSPDDPARMIGNGAVATPNVGRVHLRQDEMLVLCSDGLHKHVEPQEINGRVARRKLACRSLRAPARACAHSQQQRRRDLARRASQGPAQPPGACGSRRSAA